MESIVWGVWAIVILNVMRLCLAIRQNLKAGRSAKIAEGQRQAWNQMCEDLKNLATEGEAE